MEQRKNELININSIDDLLSYAVTLENSEREYAKKCSELHTKWWGAKIQLGKAKARLNGTQ